MVNPEFFPNFDFASPSPLFLAFLGVHVAAALVAIVTGILAMLSHKRPARHVGAGRWYLAALIVVFATSCVLASFRWPTDAPLVAVGAVAVAAAVYGFAFRRLHRPGDIPHILAMGISYIAMLTAFYVDNGPHLPIWDLLPTWSFWLLPSLVGGPLIARSIMKRRRSAKQS